MKVTIAPNVHAKPPSQEALASLPASVDEWQYYANSKRPTYGFRACVEAGVIKQYDCAGSKLIRDIPKHVSDCATLIAMDEPLAAALRPQWEYGFVFQEGHCTALIEELPTIAKRVARYIKRAHGSCLKVSWIEAWPRHHVHIWLNAIRNCISFGAYPDRLVVDYDPFARAGHLLVEHMSQLRELATLHGIELACIVTGHRATDNETFRASCCQHWSELSDAGPWDRVVVQSWQAHNSHTVPDTDVLVGMVATLL